MSDTFAQLRQSPGQHERCKLVSDERLKDRQDRNVNIAYLYLTLSSTHSRKSNFCSNPNRCTSYISVENWHVGIFLRLSLPCSDWHLAMTHDQEQYSFKTIVPVFVSRKLKKFP